MNSEYWRAKLDRNVQRDRRNDAALQSAGWTVVRIWEHEEPERAAEEITATVLAARSRNISAARPLATEPRQTLQ